MKNKLKPIKGNDLIEKADVHLSHRIAFYEKNLKDKIILDEKELKELIKSNRNLAIDEGEDCIPDIIHEILED